MPGLDDLEKETRIQTFRQESEVLTILQRLLNQYLAGFRELGEFKKTTENKREQVWLFLTTRAHTSLRCAYYLLQYGYYVQSMTLIRTALEDWLVCMDCRKRNETVEELLRKGGYMPKFQQMADRLEESFKSEWKTIYGELSTFAHPRWRAAMVTVNPETKQLRVAPDFDELLFLWTSSELISASMKMLDFLRKLVEPIAPQWTKETHEVVKQANDCKEGLFEKAEALE